MATTHEIGLFDRVELLEAIEAVPAGATGGVLEFLDAGKAAMVEFTSMPAQPVLDRIACVPLAKLRRVD